MVSLWNEKGNVMQYMEEQSDLDRYALVSTGRKRFGKLTI